MTRQRAWAVIFVAYLDCRANLRGLHPILRMRLLRPQVAIVSNRILIVDDSPLVRQRLGALLRQHPGWEICGEAVDGGDAVAKALTLKPDLIVLDFLMPGVDGLQAAREMGKLMPGIPILMFSMHLSKQLMEEAKAAGIRGAVAKTDTRHLIEGMEALLRHESFFEGS